LRSATSEPRILTMFKPRCRADDWRAISAIFVFSESIP
jgi:hypothetical protein